MEQLEEEMIEIDLKEYLNIIWRRRLMIISLLLIAIVGSYLISTQLTKIYQTSTLLMVKEDNGMENLFNEQLSIMSNNNSKIGTYSQILKSRRILREVIKELDLRNQETGELIKAKDLRSKINISGKTDNNLMTLTVNYSAPVMAKRLANRIVTIFKAENRQLNITELQSAYKFINQQLSTTEKKLAKLENKLLNYKQDNGVILPIQQGEAILKKLTQLETNQAKAEVELNQSKVSLKEVKDKLAGEDREIISTKTITENPIVRKLKSKLTDLEINLAGLKENYTDKHPQVIKVKEERAEIKNKLEQAVEQIVSSKTETINPLYQGLKERLITLETKVIALTTRVDTYQQQVKKIKGELNSLPQEQLTLARLQREIKVTEGVYTLLSKKKQEVQIQEAMKTSDIVIVDPAIVNEEPIKPNVKLNVVIATMLALFMALGIIFILEYLDTTVKNEQDIERLTSLPVLGVTPDLDQAQQQQSYYGGVSQDA